jgi:hypothetical protein
MNGAGENVGSAVGTALMTARQGATAAGKNSAAASRRLATRTARKTRRRLAEHGIDKAQLKELQDAFAESLWRARQELASKIEPPARRRRMPRMRLLMVIVTIGAVASAIAAVISKRPMWQHEAEHDRRSPDRADLAGNGATQPRQLEPSQTGPARRATTGQTTARDVTGGNGSPAS